MIRTKNSNLFKATELFSLFNSKIDLDLLEKTNYPGIYTMTYNGQPMYIGRSLTSVYKRWYGHFHIKMGSVGHITNELWSNKDNIVCQFEKIDQEDIMNVEIERIRKLRPFLNKEFNPNPKKIPSDFVIPDQYQLKELQLMSMGNNYGNSNIVEQILDKEKQKTKAQISNLWQTGEADANRDIKYFTAQQIKYIRRQVRDADALAKAKAQVTAIREWMLIDILTSTGLRSAEAADLRCGDVLTSYGESSLFVRAGKGYKARTIEIPKALKTHFNDFLKWKKSQREPTEAQDYLFLGQRGPWKATAVQQCCKKWIKKSGFNSQGASAHAFRHSYAIQLYQKSKDLTLVQRQLGHSSLQISQMYAAFIDFETTKRRNHENTNHRQ